MRDYYAIVREPDVLTIDGRATLVIRASGELDFESSDELRGMLAEAAGAATEVIAVDLARTRLVDSQALSALIGGLVAAHAAGKEVHVVNANGLVLDVLITTGLIGVFDAPRER